MPHRNQSVINSRGGSLTMSSTENREYVTMNSYGGSNFTLNNTGVSTFSHNNSQRRVDNDDFEDIANDKSSIVKGARYDRVQKDLSIVIGDSNALNSSSYEDWNNAFSKIAAGTIQPDFKKPTKVVMPGVPLRDAPMMFGDIDVTTRNVQNPAFTELIQNVLSGKTKNDLAIPKVKFSGGSWFGNLLSTAFSLVTTFAGGLLNRFANLGSLANGITSSLGNIASSLGGLAGNLGGLAGGALGGISSFASGVGGALGGLTQGVTGALGGITQGLNGAFGGLAQNLGGALGNVGQGLTGALGGLSQGLTGAVGGITQGLNGVINGVGLGGISQGLNNTLGNIGGAFGGLTQGIGGALGGATQALGSLTNNALGGLSNITGALGQNLQGAFSGITSGLGALGPNLNNALTNVTGTLGQGLGAIGQNLGGTLSNMTGGLTQGLGAISQNLGGTLTNISSNLPLGLNQVTQGIGSGITNLAGGIGNFASGLNSNLGGAINNLAGGLGQSIGGFASNITGGLGQVSQLAKGAFNSVSSGINNVGGLIANGVTQTANGLGLNKLQSLATNVGGIAGGISNIAAGGFGGVLQGAGNAISNIGRDISGTLSNVTSGLSQGVAGAFAGAASSVPQQISGAFSVAQNVGGAIGTLGNALGSISTQGISGVLRGAVNIAGGALPGTLAGIGGLAGNVANSISAITQGLNGNLLGSAVNAVSQMNFIGQNVQSLAGGLVPPSLPLPSFLNNLQQTSPSTQGGNYEINEAKAALPELIADVQNELIPIEKDMGEGGSMNVNVARNVRYVVGATVNNNPQARVDEIGIQVPNAVFVAGDGCATTVAGVPEVTEVDNFSMFPCGTYTVEVGNRFSVKSGGGGLSFNTCGTIEMNTDSVLRMNALQTMVGGDSVIIKGEKNISIDGENLNLTSKNQVLLNGNTGVTGNLLVKGGGYFDGELFVNHITAPREIQETLIGFTGEGAYGFLRSGSVITGLVGLPVLGIVPFAMILSKQVMMAVELAPHGHEFPNIPLSLEAGGGTTSAQGAVREGAGVLNFSQAALAKSITNGNKFPKTVSDPKSFLSNGISKTVNVLSMFGGTEVKN